MARILEQHAIEQFILAWLSKFRNSSDIRRERKFIEKAIQQLQFFLNPPCCVDPNATIEFRRLDNDLTRFIAAQIAQGAFDRRKWKKSLQRAIDALQARLDGCCEGEVTTILWEEDTPTNGGTFFDELLNVEIGDGETIYFEATFDIFGQPAFGGVLQATVTSESGSVEGFVFDTSSGDGSGNGFGWSASVNEPDTSLNFTFKGSVTNTTGSAQNIRLNAFYTVPYFSLTAPATVLEGSIFKYSSSPF